MESKEFEEKKSELELERLRIENDVQTATLGRIREEARAERLHLSQEIVRRNIEVLIGVSKVLISIEVSKSASKMENDCDELRKLFTSKLKEHLEQLSAKQD
jgi:hypothetical protein